MNRLIQFLFFLFAASTPLCAQVSLSTNLLTWEANETDTKYVTITSLGGTGLWECDSTVYSNHFYVSPVSGSSGSSVAITPMSTVTGDAIDGGIGFYNPNTGTWAVLDLLHKGPSGTFSVSPLTLSWGSGETQSKTVTVTGSGWTSSISGTGFSRVENTSAGTITVSPDGQNTGSSARNANLIVSKGESEKYVWLHQDAGSNGGGGNGGNGGGSSSGYITISPSATIRWSPYETDSKYVVISSTSGAWRKDTCSLGPHFSMSPTLGPSGELAWFTPSGSNETLTDIEDAVFVETNYGEGGTQITLIHEHDPYLIKPGSDSLVWNADGTGWQSVSITSAISWTARIAGGGFKLNGTGGSGIGTISACPLSANPTTFDIVAWLELSAPGARTRSVKLIQRGRSTPAVIPDTFSGSPGQQIPVSRSVTPSGAVTYAIPVMTDPVSKYAPGISLLYNSQSGNGIAGYGWHISGLSNITLIPKNRYYHGTNKAADVNGSDHSYALDGVPLVESEEYAAGTTSYPLKTVSGHIRVKRTASGFEALYPDGSKAVFGEGPATGGNTRLVYPVIRKEDILGNEITFSYLMDGGTCYPQTICYDTGLAAPDTIRLTYTDRSDYVPQYNAGVEVCVRKLLTGITISACGDILRAYTLSHGTIYGVSCLLELGYSTESGSSAESLEPLRFEYGGGVAMPAEALSTVVSDNILPILPNQSGSGSRYALSRGKFYPNSYEDGMLAIPSYSNYYRHYSDGNGHYQYYSEYPDTTTILLVPDLTGTEGSLTVATVGDGFQDAQVLDIDNDDIDDIVKVNIFAEKTTQTSRLLINTYKYNETLGEVQPKGTLPVISIQGYINDGGMTSAQQRCYRYGCLTQDGHAQLITTGFSTDVAGRSAISFTAVVDLVSGNLVGESQLFNLTPSNEANHFVADIDGDGISEICMIDDSRLAVYGLRQDGSLGNLAYHYQIKASDVTDGYRLTDLNGDGLLDIVCLSKTSDIWKVFYYTGNSFLSDYCQIDKAEPNTGLLFIDLDHDGLQDVVEFDRYGKIKYKVNTGGYMNGQIVDSGITVSEESVMLPTNTLDCRGAARFALVDGNRIRYYTFSSNKQGKRVLTRLRDSFHNRFESTYKNITQGGPCYGNDAGKLMMGQNYTERVFPLMVCDSMSVISGGSLIEYIRREYRDAAVNTLGLGFICYGSTYEYDLLGNKKTKNIYDPATLGAVVESYSYSGSLSTPDSWSHSLINPILNEYGNAVDAKVLDSWTYNEIYGVVATSSYTYDRYGLPLSVTTSRRIGNGSPKTETKTITYSHCLVDSLYVLGALAEEQTHKGSLAGRTEFTLDSLKRPIRTKSYTGMVSGSDTTWCQTSDRIVTYDVHGNVTSDRTAAYGSTTYNESTYAYDNAGRYMMASMDPLGRTTTYLNYNKYGQPTQVRDWLGRQALNTYDVWGNLISKTDPDSTVSVQTKTWSASGEPGLYCIGKTVTGQPDTKVWYDALGREVRSANKRFDGSWQYVTSEYDSRGRLSRTSLPYKNTAISPTLWNTYEYDSYNRPIRLSEANGKQTTWSYSGTSTTMVKDSLVTTSTTDAEGNVVRVVDTGGTIDYALRDDGQPSAVTLTYGTAPNLETVTTTFQYDSYGRRTAIIDPSAGTRTDAYTDNADGTSSVAHTGPNGTVTSYYDRFGRVTSVTRPEFNTSYTYGTTLYDSSYGKLLSEVSTNGTSRAFTYDGYGRPVTETEHADSTNWLRRTYTYGAGSNIATVNYTTQDGSITTETFNYANGHNTGLSIPGTTVFSLHSENALGQPTDIRSGGVKRFYDYTAAGIPSRRRILDDQNTVLQDFGYSYDSLTGNLMGRTDVVPSPDGNIETSESFGYDGLNRLESAEMSYTLPEIPSPEPEGPGPILPDSTSVIIPSYFYGEITANYDSKGNILSRGVINSTYTDVSDPYAMSGAGWGAGGEEQEPYASGRYLRMTSFDRPSEVGDSLDFSGTCAIYEYDASGSKVRASIPIIGIERVYLGSVYEKDVRTWEAWNDNLNDFELRSETIRRLFLGGDAYDAPMVLVKVNDGAWTPYNIGRDVQGSITHIMSGDGELLERYVYDPWGCANKVDTTGQYVDSIAVVGPYGGGNIWSRITGSHGYTGHEHIPGINLINANARIYDPAIGRFLSPDSLIQDPTSTQNFNRYSYCLNNPLKYTDESGEYFGWDDAGAALLGGVINWIAHGADFTQEGLAYFTAGLLGGVASLYVDPLVSAWLLEALNSIINQGFSADGNTWTGNLDPIKVSYDAIIGAIVAKLGGEMTSQVSSMIGDFSDIIPGKAWSSMLNQSLSNGVVSLGGNTIQAYASSHGNSDLTYWEAFANGLPGVAESMAYGAVIGIGEGVCQAHALGEDPWTGDVKVSYKPLGANSRKFNAKKLSDSYLKQNGLDAHAIKTEYVGNNHISRYNLYLDHNGQIIIYPNGGGEPIWTDYFINNTKY